MGINGCFQRKDRCNFLPRLKQRIKVLKSKGQRKRTINYNMTVNFNYFINFIRSKIYYDSIAIIGWADF